MSQVQPYPGMRPARALPLDIWGATDKGRQREGNEDSVYPHTGFEASSFVPSPAHLARQGQLLVVADGVGGSQAGAQASQWAIRVAVEKYYELHGPDRGNDLGAAIEFANASLYQYLQSTGTQEAGCTMAAAVVHNNLLYVANVGDSRVYVIRSRQAVQHTRDHTLTQQKLDSGVISLEEAKTDSGRNVLTRSLGAGETVRVDVFAPLQLTEGDVVLLCSDGLTDMLSNDGIARLVGNHPSRRAARRLIDAANRQGGYDNISVVLARVGAKPSGGGGLLGGLDDAIRRMSTWQKIVVLAGGMFLVAAFCAMVVVGWLMAQEMWPPKTTATPPAPTATTTRVPPTATVEPTVLLSPTPVMTLVDTATPRPTATPTPTSTPTLLPDQDGDGVPDYRDDCPDEPGLPALDGCPDRDGDGVADRVDRCPDAPGEFEGCPDSDGDGIHDGDDRCPNEPGAPEHGGCPAPPKSTKAPKPTQKPTAPPP
jgi:serine/threonine protein phosphatase PrpC